MCGTEVTVWCVLLLAVLFLHACAHAVLLAKAFSLRALVASEGGSAAFA